jgi:hypothetical protein
VNDVDEVVEMIEGAFEHMTDEAKTKVAQEVKSRDWEQQW